MYTSTKEKDSRTTIHRTSHAFQNIRKRKNYYSPSTHHRLSSISAVSSSKSQFSSPRFGGAMSCIGSSLSPSAIAAVTTATIRLARLYLLPPPPLLRWRSSSTILVSVIDNSRLLSLAPEDGVESFSPGTSKGIVPPADGSGMPSTSSLRKSSISVVSIACFLDDECDEMM
jgi:hypothetical protein